MYKKIIVGYEGSARSDDAVALARLLDEQLVLVNVYPRVPALDRTGEAGYRKTLADRSLQVLGDGARKWSLEHDGAVRAVASTSRARGLDEMARAENADLIVLGSTGRGTMGRVLVGSVGERLLHGSPVPVAVAPLGFADNDEEQGLRVIGVAYDGSPDSELALDAAIGAAESAEASLRLVAVAEPIAVPYRTVGYASLPPYEELQKEYLDSKMAEALERAPASVRAEGKVLKGGDVATVLASEAEAGIDLLFCGSRGYGPLRRVLLGGVSSKLMRLSPCPVVVVPRSTVEAEDGAEVAEARESV
jgi:nucleotide-binding universal stress UspA family protein